MLLFQLLHPSRCSERILKFSVSVPVTSLGMSFEFSDSAPVTSLGMNFEFSISVSFSQPTISSAVCSKCTIPQEALLAKGLGYWCTPHVDADDNSVVLETISSHDGFLTVSTSSVHSWVHAIRTYTRPHERDAAKMSKLCSMIELTNHVYVEADSKQTQFPINTQFQYSLRMRAVQLRIRRLSLRHPESHIRCRSIAGRSFTHHDEPFIFEIPSIKTLFRGPPISNTSTRDTKTPRYG